MSRQLRSGRNTTLSPEADMADDERGASPPVREQPQTLPQPGLNPDASMSAASASTARPAALDPETLSPDAIALLIQSAKEKYEKEQEQLQY